MMIGIPLHLLWSYIFVIYLDLEIVGTAIAMIITNGSIFLGSLYITARQDDLIEAVNIKISHPLVFVEICDYLKIAFPSMTVIFIDWSVGQILVLWSGFFGVTSQAAYTVVFNISVLMFMLPYGIQSSTTALVGAEIGAGRVSTAQQYYKLI